MKKGITLLTLISAFFLGNQAEAQVGLNRANQNYEKLAYYDAIQIYEKVADRGFIDSNMLKNLGNSYYFNGEYAQANKWYSQLFTDFGTEAIEPEYDYRYAVTLQNIGEATKAETYFKKFALANSNSSRAKFIKNDKDSKLEIQKNSGRFTIEDLAINSPYTDYVGSFYNNQVLFTSARDTGNFTKRVFTWTGDSFTKLYQSEINEDGSLATPVEIKGQVNSKFNESSAIVTKNGQTMYFTRNNYANNKRGYSSDKITLLKIYKAELINGKWENISELPFNSDEFNTADPVLNEAEDTMYFVSDRPGGYGSSDIWKVQITKSGFGTPVNLGPEINTDGRETFPFITPDEELYFATDARQGLGGLDVYVTKIQADGSFTAVQNVGEPINSSSDDFGYIINKQTKKGYFSSNRPGGVGKDDIYKFTEHRALVLECIQNLNVVVVDSKTRQIITDANLSLFAMDYTPKATTNRMINGKYEFATNYECGESYRLKVEYPDYVVKEEVVVLENQTGVTDKTIVLERKKKEIKKNDDLFKILNLAPIYFDFDKDNIREDAAIELAKIVEVMKEYPKMKIDVRSFTDSRGSSAYNLKLSDRRAKSTANWIISHGIENSRVSYKGYGDTQLLNKCSKGVKCTDEEQAVNRRSEFIVTEI